MTARRVGPPPTAVSTVKQPPSPMQIDNKPTLRIPFERLNFRAKDYQKFLSKGNRPAKVFAAEKYPSEIVVQYNRPNGRHPHFVILCQYSLKSYVLKAPDSKYHVPAQWEAASEICEQLSHSQPGSLCHATRSTFSATSPDCHSTEPSPRCNNEVSAR